MTAHATIAELAERAAWSDLAEAAAPDAPAVVGDVLRGFVADGTVPDDVDALSLDAARTRLERVLADASAEVDGYLAGRYGTLDATTVPVLGTRTLDIAVYRLLGDNARSADERGDRYEVWRGAIAWLEAVAAGTIDVLPPSEPAAGAGDVRYASRPLSFDRDTLGRL